MKKVLVDTNVLIDGFSIDKKVKYVLLSHVNRELEKHKMYGDRDLKYKARKAVRFIKENEKNFEFDINDYHAHYREQIDDDYVDNKIIQACLDNGYALMTGDLLLEQQAKMYGVELVSVREVEEDNYSGVKVIKLTPKQYEELNQNLDKNKHKLLKNEYLLVQDKEGKDMDALVWNGSYLERIGEGSFRTDLFGKFKCFDYRQKMLVHSIEHNDITFVNGKAGTGKSHISMNVMWKLIETHKYDKMVVFCNPTKTRDSQELGFYKGTRTEKLLDSQVGIFLKSKFGGEEMLRKLIEEGIIELLPFCDIRGYDTSSEKKTLMYITEVQNLSADLLKLGLQRLGSNTKAILDGDVNAQVDLDIYRTDNGAKRMSKVFRGEDIYGQVELGTIYRSRIAAIADKM